MCKGKDLGTGIWVRARLMVRVWGKGKGRVRTGTRTTVRIQIRTWIRRGTDKDRDKRL